jgi:hypothetical protein
MQAAGPQRTLEIDRRALSTLWLSITVVASVNNPETSAGSGKQAS